MRRFILFSIVGVWLFSSCNENESSTPVTEKVQLEINFDHFFNNDSILLDQSIHVSQAGDSLKFEALKFFVSEVRLLKAGGDTVKVPFYGLIDMKRPAFRKLLLSDLPAGNYSGMLFSVGIDSATNSADPNQYAPGSVLNPLVHQDMYWDWATGFIFCKVEGSYPSSSGVTNSFVFHFGFNRWKKSHLITKNFTLQPGVTALRLKADWGKMFNNPQPYDLETMGDFSHSIGDSTRIPVLFGNMTGMMSAR